MVHAIIISQNYSLNTHSNQKARSGLKRSSLLKINFKIKLFMLLILCDIVDHCLSRWVVLTFMRMQSKQDTHIRRVWTLCTILITLGTTTSFDERDSPLIDPLCCTGKQEQSK